MRAAAAATHSNPGPRWTILFHRCRREPAGRDQERWPAGGKAMKGWFSWRSVQLEDEPIGFGPNAEDNLAENMNDRTTLGIDRPLTAGPGRQKGADVLAVKCEPNGEAPFGIWGV